MKELQIKLTGTQSLDHAVVLVDHQPLKFHRNAYGNYVCQYQTDQNQVHLQVTRTIDVGGVYWLLAQIFFFLISIFGIFDVHHKDNCLALDFSTEVELQDDNQLTLQIQTPRADSRAVNVETNLVTREKVNQYRLDSVAKQRLKRLGWLKILVVVAVAVIAITTLITKF